MAASQLPSPWPLGFHAGSPPLSGYRILFAIQATDRRLPLLVLEAGSNRLLTSPYPGNQVRWVHCLYAALANTERIAAVRTEERTVW